MATLRLDAPGLKTVFPAAALPVNHESRAAVVDRDSRYHFALYYREAPIPVLLCVPAAASIDR